MRKIGVIFVGIVLAIMILFMEGSSVVMKRTFVEVMHDIEGGLIGVYHIVRSFVTELERI